MSVVIKVSPRTTFMGRLNHGSDLLEEITAICRREDIRLGRIEALGAVQKACLGFYDQQLREYQFLVLDQPMEITKLIGNVSLKDNTPFVHAHITLADRTGHAYGGHLAPGTTVFACEFIVETFDGPVLERVFDEVTSLPLWVMPE
jgi:uncharacterized protein